MFKNLLIEFSKNNIELSDIADFLNISPASLNKKLAGENDFELSECLKLQNLIGNGDVCLEYLFKRL